MVVDTRPTQFGVIAVFPPDICTQACFAELQNYESLGRHAGVFRTIFATTLQGALT